MADTSNDVQQLKALGATDCEADQIATLAISFGGLAGLVKLLPQLLQLVQLINDPAFKELWAKIKALFEGLSPPADSPSPFGS